MKKLFMIAASVALASTSANAADMAARPYTKAPPIAALYDWSGFYVGANGGYASSRNCWNFESFAGAPFTAGQGCHDADGAVAGGQIGYRWQSAAFVFGLEAQGNWADLSGSSVSSPAFVFAPGDLTINSKLQAFGLFTGQVGYAWNNVLLYAKGGAAVVDNRFYHTFTGTNTLINSSDNTTWGATVGAGLEVGFAPNWSIGVEYNHLFMERETFSFAAAPLGVATTNSIRQDVDMVTARINYRFGGPAIARYSILRSNLSLDEEEGHRTKSMPFWFPKRTSQRSLTRGGSKADEGPFRRREPLIRRGFIRATFSSRGSLQGRREETARLTDQSIPIQMSAQE